MFFLTFISGLKTSSLAPPSSLHSFQMFARSFVVVECNSLSLFLSKYNFNPWNCAAAATFLLENFVKNLFVFKCGAMHAFMAVAARFVACQLQWIKSVEIWHSCMREMVEEAWASDWVVIICRNHSVNAILAVLRYRHHDSYRDEERQGKFKFSYNFYLCIIL